MKYLVARHQTKFHLEQGFLKVNISMIWVAYGLGKRTMMNMED